MIYLPLGCIAADEADEPQVFRISKTHFVVTEQKVPKNDTFQLGVKSRVVLFCFVRVVLFLPTSNAVVG